MFNKFSVAPLYKYTDRHCRYFYSLFTNYIKLYTGMVCTSSFLRKYKEKKLLFNNIKNVPVAIQFIGNNCKDLYKSAKIARKLNFSEINFNLGCPSKSSYFGRIGFYLMSDIKHVINCINSLILGAKNINVSIKHRINYNYCYNNLLNFIGNISLFTKCKYFIIHARSILKDNFSTKLNLKLPVLNYDYIYKLKKDLPHLNIILNGNLSDIKDIDYHLNYVDGVMMGRKLYSYPSILFDVDNYFSKKNKNINLCSKNNIFLKNKINPKLRFIFLKLYLYIIEEMNLYNTHPFNILKHVINIFKNIKNSFHYKSRLIQSSYNFKYFSCFNDFEIFLYKDLI